MEDKANTPRIGNFSKEAKNEVCMSKRYPFQTAKAMANTLINNEFNEKLQNNSSNMKFTFHKAGAALQSSSSCDEKHDSHESMETDLENAQIPFSEEQIKEFGGRSNIMLGFQTAKQCERQNTNVVNSNMNVGFTNEVPRTTTVEKKQMIETSYVGSVEEPVDVLQDLNKILSKYEDPHQDKGPKKKVIFNKKNTLRSKSSATENDSSETDVDTSSAPVSMSCTIHDNVANQPPTSSKCEEADKMKIVFGRKTRNLRSSTKIVEQKTKKITEVEQNKTFEDIDCKEEKKVLRKRVVFKKSFAGVTTVPTIAPEEDVDYFSENDDHDVKSDSDSDDKDFIIEDAKARARKKVVFKKPAKRRRPEVVFKIPDTDKFLEIKQKTQRATEILPEKKPKKVIFSRTIVSKMKKTTLVNNIKSLIPSHDIRNQSSNNAKKSQPDNKQVSIKPSPIVPMDVKTELSELDKKPVRNILDRAKNLNKKSRQVIAASATSVCEPECDGSDSFRKKPKVEIDKPTTVPLGPPIKVPTRLPDLIGAYTLGGQRLLFSPNEARPLLFQNEAEADWWDAATYTNFLRMKHSLGSGDYLHPDLSTSVEEQVKASLRDTEQQVEVIVRDLEWRALLEKYILCHWEEALVNTSGNIEQWLDECFEMSPCAVRSLSRNFDRLLRIPVTMVMIKKTMCLASIYWNICELKHGMWSRVLCQKGNAVLQHIKESFQLTHPFTKSYYEAAMFDLIADFQFQIEVLSFNERILITHSMTEEMSFAKRDPLIMNTKPDVNEMTLDGYEFTENDQKNLVMLKLLLRLPNQTSQPVFLPRNRIKGKQNGKSFGLKQCKMATVGTFPPEFSNTQGEHEYDYYDRWNFKTHPKRINRSVEKVQDISNKKTSTYTDNNFKTNEPANIVNNTTDSICVQRTRKYNSLDTFEYNNTGDVADRNYLLKADSSTMSTKVPFPNIKPESQAEQELMDTTIEMNYTRAGDQNETLRSATSNINIVPTKTYDIFSDTLRILDDDNIEQMDMLDENCSSNENYSDISNIIESTFNSQDMKLIYSVLDREKLVDSAEYNPNYSTVKAHSEDNVPDVSNIMEEGESLYLDRTEQLYEDKDETFDIKRHIMSARNADAMLIKQDDRNANEIEGMESALIPLIDGMVCPLNESIEYNTLRTDETANIIDRGQSDLLESNGAIPVDIIDTIGDGFGMSVENIQLISCDKVKEEMTMRYEDENNNIINGWENNSFQ